MSKQHQWSYKVLIVWTAFYGIWILIQLNHADKHYIRDRQPKVGACPLMIATGEVSWWFSSLWADFSCNTSLCSCIAIFHLWLLLELPNTCTLMYDSRTLATFVWCHVSLILLSVLFGHCHFGSLLANSRILRAEIHYSSRATCIATGNASDYTCVASDDW